MIENFAQLEEKLLANNYAVQKVAVVRAANKQTITSLLRLTEQGLIFPILIDDEQKLKELLAELPISEENYEIIAVTEDEEAAFKGVELVRNGRANFIMKGNLPTSDLLKQVVNRETGIRDKLILSHLALLEIPNYPRLVGITDGGMMLTPDVDQKEAIIENALQVMAGLQYERPKVAILSAAETVHPKLPASVDAEQLANRYQNRNDCIVEGPISIDLALNPQIAADKKYEGKIKGDADVLIAADVVGGNTLSKSLILFAGGEMAGIIVGAKVPIILTSRSSTATEKKYSLLLALQISRSLAGKGVD